jgi:GntR family transcriptional regulator/MocR family aminotransferase
MIHTSELSLFLDPKGTGPLYMRVAASVVQAIRDPRIHPGEPLPGIRELAAMLGVHRNTALAAMRELETQGWVEARPRCGFYVTERPSETGNPAQLAPAPGSLGFDLPISPRNITDAKDLRMDCSDGVADGRLAPTEAMAQAYLRALRLKGPQLLQASDFKGLKRLRAALVDHLGQRRALRLHEEQVLVVRSTSMAVSLAAQTLIGSRGGVVAVEDPGHPALRETLLQASSATLVPLPVDGQGLCLEPLEALLRSGPLALLVLTPQCHYPTGVSLAPQRRARILELAAEHRFAILELDFEYDYLRGEAASHPPLAAQDSTGQVLYVGSFSRAIAPGLRLGYMAVPPPLAGTFAKARQSMDWMGDSVQEWVMSELILDGDYRRHLRRVRKAFLERRETLMDALRHAFSGRLRFNEEHGAMALWLEGQGEWADPMRFEMWVRSCGLKGIKLRPGSYFSFDGKPRAATRFGFTAHSPEELQVGIALLG